MNRDAFRTVVKAAITYDGQVLSHCRAETTDAVAADDLQAVQWVDPTELTAYLTAEEAERVRTRPRQRAFFERLSER